jgi:transmembrane sensor
VARSWSLRPAEQWRWPADGPSVRTVRPETVTAWTQGRIVFDATRLADAIAEINRYGGQTIILDAPQLGARQISGSFEAGDEDSFATAVTALLPLRRTLDGQGRIRLTADEVIRQNKSTRPVRVGPLVARPSPNRRENG